MLLQTIINRRNFHIVEQLAALANDSSTTSSSTRYEFDQGYVLITPNKPIEVLKDIVNKTDEPHVTIVLESNFNYTDILPKQDVVEIDKVEQYKMRLAKWVVKHRQPILHTTSIITGTGMALITVKDPKSLELYKKHPLVANVASFLTIHAVGLITDSFIDTLERKVKSSV